MLIHKAELIFARLVLRVSVCFSYFRWLIRGCLKCEQKRVFTLFARRHRRLCWYLDRVVGQGMSSLSYRYPSPLRLLLPHSSPSSWAIVTVIVFVCRMSNSAGVEMRMGANGKKRERETTFFILKKNSLVGGTEVCEQQQITHFSARIKKAKGEEIAFFHVKKQHIYSDGDTDTRVPLSPRSLPLHHNLCVARQLSAILGPNQTPSPFTTLILLQQCVIAMEIQDPCSYK